MGNTRNDFALFRAVNTVLRLRCRLGLQPLRRPHDRQPNECAAEIAFRQQFVAVRSIVIRRLDEGVHLPDFVGRQAKAEGGHQGAFAAVNNGFKEPFIAQLAGEQVGASATGGLVTD